MEVPNPANPRKHFDQTALEELAESIKQVGILEPLVVVDKWDDILAKNDDNTRYRLVAGERRWRAAQLAGLERVPVVIRKLTPEQELEVMLVENLQREDLDPIEEALAFAGAIARGWKQTELAEKLGISQSQVANRIRLLILPKEVKELISREIISSGHGLALVKVAHVPELVEKIIKYFSEHHTSVADAGRVVGWHVAREGKPLFSVSWDSPLFDHQEICIKTKCKMRVHGKYEHEKDEHPYCLDTKCWEKHQAAAKQQKVDQKLQELAEQSDINDVSELPVLDDLPWDSYEVFTSYVPIKTEDCSADCEHLQDAVKRGEIVKACLNPECWKEKEKAIKRKQNREKKEVAQAFEEKKDSILQMCSMYDQLPRQVLIYMATQAIFDPPTSGVTTWTKATVREQLYKDRGWKLPNFDDRTWPYPDEIKDIVTHLGELSDRELWDVILFGLLRGITQDDFVYQLTLGAEGGEGDGQDSA